MYDRQVRPNNNFVEFKREETEQSIPGRFDTVKIMVCRLDRDPTTAPILTPKSTGSEY